MFEVESSAFSSARDRAEERAKQSHKEPRVKKVEAKALANLDRPKGDSESLRTERASIPSGLHPNKVAIASRGGTW